MAASKKLERLVTELEKRSGHGRKRLTFGEAWKLTILPPLGFEEQERKENADSDKDSADDGGDKNDTKPAVLGQAHSL